jgi:hypothetical protein
MDSRSLQARLNGFRMRLHLPERPTKRPAVWIGSASSIAPPRRRGAAGERSLSRIILRRAQSILIEELHRRLGVWLHRAGRPGRGLRRERVDGRIALSPGAEQRAGSKKTILVLCRGERRSFFAFDEARERFPIWSTALACASWNSIHTFVR